MKFFGDLGFLDTSKTDPGSAAPAGDGPELVADSPQRQDLPPPLTSVSPSADSSGADSSGTDHYAAAVRVDLPPKVRQTD